MMSHNVLENALLSTGKYSKILESIGKYWKVLESTEEYWNFRFEKRWKPCVQVCITFCKVQHGDIFHHMFFFWLLQRHVSIWKRNGRTLFRKFEN